MRSIAWMCTTVSLRSGRPSTLIRSARWRYSAGQGAGVAWRPGSDAGDGSAAWTPAGTGCPAPDRVPPRPYRAARISTTATITTATEPNPRAIPRQALRVGGGAGGGGAAGGAIGSGGSGADGGSIGGGAGG